MFEWILEQEIGNLKWVEQLNKDTSIQKQAHIKGRKIREMSVWGKKTELSCSSSVRSSLYNCTKCGTKITAHKRRHILQ